MEKIGNIASVLGLILAIIQITTGTSQTMISALILSIFFMLLVVSWIKHNSSKHYIVAQKKAQDLHYKMATGYEKYKTYTLDKSIHELSNVCYQIANMFTELRHCEVSVCVKYTNCDNDIYYVKTLCRDPSSHQKRENLYDENILDVIDKNTDFKEIFKKIDDKKDWKEVFFFSNFLPQRHQYNNTHLKSEVLPDNLLSFFSRNKKWPLCYKSTIVVPILSDDNKTIYGYLCVDSPKNRGFNKKYDIRLVQDLALFIAPTIRYVSEKHLKTDQDGKK
jgi:transcriptional regulator with GAF, ATPase, and Fis domain